MKEQTAIPFLMNKIHKHLKGYLLLAELWGKRHLMYICLGFFVCSFVLLFTYLQFVWGRESQIFFFLLYFASASGIVVFSCIWHFYILQAFFFTPQQPITYHLNHLLLESNSFIKLSFHITMWFLSPDCTVTDTTSNKDSWGISSKTTYLLTI